MAGPKPALGFRSRTDAVLALRGAGHTDREIAERLDIPVNNVAALGASAKRRRRPSERDGKTVVFPNDILVRLRPHADRRGISNNELARRIVEAAIDDGIIDAILDDSEATA